MDNQYNYYRPDKNYHCAGENGLQPESEPPKKGNTTKALQRLRQLWVLQYYSE